MHVTKIEPVTKMKYKVFIEEKFAFVLYKGELSRYHIAEGCEVNQELIERIQSDVVLKRAKLRTMHLLKDMDRTEMQLRQKLRQGLYTEEIIDQAVAYVKSFGYIQDEAYAERFVTGRQKTKSRKELYAALSQKGVSKEVIENALEECYAKDNELEAIKKILEKKHFLPESAGEKETAKMYGYLIRRGFRYEDIRQVIHVSEWNA